MIYSSWLNQNEKTKHNFKYKELEEYNILISLDEHKISFNEDHDTTFTTNFLIFFQIQGSKLFLIF